jgi:hypothetical protein
MAEALSAADRSSLAAEQGPVTMGVGGVLVFEAGPGLEHARVLERVATTAGCTSACWPTAISTPPLAVMRAALDEATADMFAPPTRG